MPAHLATPDHEPVDDDPVLYQIRVNGHLGPILLSAFPALVSQQQGSLTWASRCPGRANHRVTVTTFHLPAGKP
jgi:hypothetical protein